MGEEALSFGEADERMLRLASGLQAIGIAAETRVLVGLPNGIRAVLVHAALRELGAVIVPLLAGLRLPELSFQVNHCEAEILLAEEPLASLLLGELSSLPHLRTVVVPATAAAAERKVRRIDLAEVETSERATPKAPAGHDERSPSAILYTSGSTGRPKGVVIPAGSLSNAGIGYSERFGIDADDNIFVATPIAHAVGALTMPGMALVQGCRMTVVDHFSPSRFWAEVEASSATTTILFPAQLNLLLHLDAGPTAGKSPLRLVITHAWIERFRTRFGVELGLCWGMTETGAVGVGTPPGWHPEDGGAGGAVGQAMRGVEVAIRDLDGAPVPSATEGELWTRNDHRMLEYLADEEATRTTIDAEGWLHSGDRAAIDAAGWISYRGRVKNMIKRSGENISPLEIEAVLDSHGEIAESVVVGVPDPLRTEEVVALAVLRAGAELAPAALAAYASDRLARWKAPRYFALSYEQLPRLANGKIDRAEIVAGFDLDRCWDARAAVGR
jgi:acyl-CoA synthetase (AMP-forming)/AMP-acid ligase II